MERVINGAILWLTVLLYLPIVEHHRAPQQNLREGSPHQIIVSSRIDPWGAAACIFNSMGITLVWIVCSPPSPPVNYALGPSKCINAVCVMGPPLPVCFVASKYTSLHCYTFCYPPSIPFISPEKLYYPAGWFPGEKHTSVYNGSVNESKSGLAVCNKTSSCHSWQCREYDMSARLPLGIKKWQSSTEEWA